MDAGPVHDDLLLRLLAASEQRARVISGNLANLNAPGYRRREVHFEDLLRSALREGDDTADVAPEVTVDLASEARPDGNNVSLELELNALRENKLLYETYAAILEGRLNLQRIAITEGR